MNTTRTVVFVATAVLAASVSMSISLLAVPQAEIGTPSPALPSSPPPPIREPKPPLSPPPVTCTFYVTPEEGAYLWRKTDSSWTRTDLARPVSLRQGRYTFKAGAAGMGHEIRRVSISGKNKSVQFRLKPQNPPSPPTNGQLAWVSVGDVAPSDAIIEVAGTEASAGSKTEVSSGEVTVTISADGYLTWSKTKKLQRGENWSVGDISLQADNARFKLIVSPNIDGSRAWLNDTRITPGETIQLQPGFYTLVVAADGYEPEKQDFELGNRGDKIVTVSLKKVPQAWIDVEIDGPTTAAVVIDGELVDHASGISVSPGSHKVTVAADGYDTTSQTVDVSDGEHKRVRAILLKTSNTGKVRLTISPSDVSVSIDGVQTRAGEFDLGVGQHEVLVRKRDYVDVRKTFNVEGNRTSVIDISMEKEYHLQAIDLCDAANDKLDEAYNAKGKQKDGPLDAAEFLCKQALDLYDRYAPEDTERRDTWQYVSWSSHDSLGTSYFEQARRTKSSYTYTRAENELRAAIKADPERSYSHYVLAALLTQTENDNKTYDFAEALREFQKAVELDPGNGRFYADYSVALTLNRDATGAKQAAQNARDYGAPKDSIPSDAMIDEITKSKRR